MARYYRLTDLGYSLPAGAHVLPKDAFAPIEEANALIAEAERQAAAIAKEAEEGYRRECERGYADGLSRASFEALERLLSESGALDDALRQTESELTDLVALCVRKLVDGFDDKARAEAVVRSALKKMRREKRAELRVAPQQFAHFKAVIGAVVAEFPEVELVDVVEDAALTPPQVVLESSIGRVEADLGARLDELEGVIRGAAIVSQRADAGEVR